MRNEVRLEVDWNETVSSSFSDARTIRVKEAFTSGGAQVAGGRKSKTIEFADNLDFALGKKHALRAGVLVEGGSYRSDETRNFNGTYTFSSNDAYLAGQALQFSQRIGDPLVEYRSFQFGAYLQDDFRVQKNLLVSYGLRYEAQTHLERQRQPLAARQLRVDAVQERQHDDPRRLRRLQRLVRGQPLRAGAAAGRRAPARPDRPQPDLPGHRPSTARRSWRRR